MFGEGLQGLLALAVPTMANYLGKFRSQLVPVSLPEGGCDGIASDFQRKAQSLAKNARCGEFPDAS